MTTVFTGRITYGGADRLDTTVKSASHIDGVILAPVWSMVMGHKKNLLTDAQYTEQYYDLLRIRYQENTELFRHIFERQEVTLLCFCAAGKFCHRHLAVDILEKLTHNWKLPFIRGGERD